MIAQLALDAIRCGSVAQESVPSVKNRGSQ